MQRESIPARSRAIIIPARMASVRLPGKPLADIGGRPMIAHVVERALQSGVGPVILAAGDEEILEACAGISGLTCVRTPSALPSGSDRVFSALDACDPEGRYTDIINLQGDLPFIEPEAIRKAACVLDDKSADMGTLGVPLSADQAENPARVKIALGDAGRHDSYPALYFSRAPIVAGNGGFIEHIGIYAWRRSALARFCALTPTGLERAERLEQLRALENGFHIRANLVEKSPLSVDTPEDLARARNWFQDGILALPRMA